jgi:tol-pal system protein YbgF
MAPRIQRAVGSSILGMILGAIGVVGCGSVEETQQWEETPTVSATARLEYRIDSLMSENRRMRQQLEAMANENRSLTARNAELETRLNEAMAAPKPAPPPADMSSAYSEALGYYRQRDFATAIQRFESLLNSGVRDDLADNCHYWIGESYYGMGNYSGAIQHFEMVFNYKHSEKKSAAQLMIGNSYAAQRNYSAAKDAYNKVISNYPASVYVQKAQEKLGVLR